MRDNKMKRLVLITGVILMGCLFTGAFFSPESEINTQNTIASENTTIEKKNEQHINEEYILKSENNRLVVYKKGENTPYKVTDTVTDRLPHSDILRLEKGITVTGTVNLRKALEDYCS